MFCVRRQRGSNSLNQVFQVPSKRLLLIISASNYMKWKSAKDSRSVLLQVKHQFEPNDGGPDLLA